MGSTSVAFTEACTSDGKSMGTITETEEERNVCWICLDSDSPSRPLEQPCKCPRYCHLRCLARWQLQSAGTKREFHCDFCDCRLPDWRQALSVQSSVDAPAIMNVSFEGKTYSFEVKPGSSGYSQFTEAIRHAFQLPVDSELNITFTCDEPCTDDGMTGSLLTLQGPGAYDAAVYCAFVSAARRQVGHRRSHSVSGTQSVTDPDGSMAVGRQETRLSSRHQRSHTTVDTSTTPGLRSIDSVQQTRFTRSRHRRSSSNNRSVSQARSQRDSSMTAGNTPPTDNGNTTASSKAWIRAARKVRALYHRLLNK